MWVNNTVTGGQAVIEGVMMRGRRGMAIAVRTPKNDINLHEERLQSLSSRYPILKRPIIRGTVALIESLTLGMRSLNHSASVAAEGEGEELSTKELVLTVALAVALTVGLFIMFPAFIVRIIQERVASNILLNLLEGLVKITVFVGYIVAIGFFPDIRRVFEYHGAEHKAINCLESGQELTVDNAKGHTTIHARCGTNFLLIVFFTSVFLFSFWSASLSAEGPPASCPPPRRGRHFLRDHQTGGQTVFVAHFPPYRLSRDAAAAADHPGAR